MAGWLRGSVGSGPGENGRAGLWSTLPHSLWDQQVHGVSSPQFSFPKFNGTGLCSSRRCVVLTQLPRILMRPAQKWTVFRKNGTCFSFSYPCLSFYFIPIFIPSTLRNKPKQLFNSEDFFTVRWYDGVRCQPRDPMGRCQSPELGSSCQRPTPAGETSRAQHGYPEPERHGPLTPTARLGSYQRPGTLGHSAVPMADLQHSNRWSQSPGTASTGTGSHR